ncbi:MAG: hypothetical protein RSE58_08380 [Clostridia bacterium]
MNNEPTKRDCDVIDFDHFDGLSTAMENAAISDIQKDGESTDFQKGHSRNHIRKHTVAALVCSLLGAILFACFVVLFSFTQCGFDAQAHKKIATSGSAIAAQRKLLTEKMTQLSQKEAFDEAVVLEAISDGDLADYTSACSSWLWEGVLKSSKTDMPAWQTAKIETALKADPVFLAAHPTDAEAAAKLAYKLGTVTSKVVFPLQPAITSMALQFLESTNLLPKLRIAELILFVIAVLLLLFPLMILRKMHRLALWYMGIGLLFSGMLVFVFRRLLESARFGHVLANANEALGFQAEYILANIYQTMEISSGVLLGVGAICAMIYLIWRSYIIRYSHYELQSYI